MAIRRAGRTAIAPGFLSGGVVNSIDIPANVRPGDLMVLTLMGGAMIEGDVPKSLCVDPRMQRIDVTSNTDEPDSGNRSFSVWAARYEAGGYMAVDIRLWMGEGQYDQFGMAFLDIYRDDSGAGVELEEGRANWIPSPFKGGTAPKPTPGGHFPGLLGQGHTGLLIVGAWYSGFAGLDQKVNFGRPHFTDVYDITGNPLGTGGYLDIYTFTSQLHEVPAVRFAFQALPLVEAILKDGAFAWAVVLGMRPDAPPVTRQYPRDDGLGLSSAARRYPIRRGPAGGRRVGGHR